MALPQSRQTTFSFGSSAFFRACVACLMFLILPLDALSESALLVNSKEYKDKDFIKGCISDYSDLVEGNDVNWVWIAPGVKLADFRVTLGKFENKSDELRSSQVGEIKSIFQEFLGKLNGEKGFLTADVCIYEVQKFSQGKAWIPFAGGHQMQAGVGAEAIVKGGDGKTVAKFRHFAREGARIEDAAQEVAEDLMKYMKKN
ncbi:MAG: hypothetical protein HY942_07925 [Gammaproteobacteria bacterium]|nr:hypothetical protein [Gammaproteobacteria bacterium]